jgi:hypothetical protein
MTVRTWLVTLAVMAVSTIKVDAQSVPTVTYNELGVEYTQRDIDLRDKVAMCDNHEVGANAAGQMTSPPTIDPTTHQLTNIEWQAPCQKLREMYRDSGAMGKWQEIRKRQTAEQLKAVTEGLK